MILTCLNQKGGVGKTTLSLNIATALALKGKRVLVIDADPQSSALNFSYVRKTDPLFPIIGIPKPSLHKEVVFHKGNFDTIIIDCPPQIRTIAQSALKVSDMIMIPVQPSPYDIWATHDVVEMVKEAQELNDSLKAFFVLNRVITNTVIGREIFDILSRYELPCLKTHVFQRVAFAESATFGMGVSEMKTARDAANDIEKLIVEIFE